MDSDPNQSGDLQDPAEPKRVDVSQDTTQEPSQPVETVHEQVTTEREVTEETPNLGGGENLVEGSRDENLPTEAAPESQDDES